MSDLAALRQRVDSVEKDTSRVVAFAFGNGKVGADERLRNIETLQTTQSATVDRIDKKLDQVLKERAASANQWIGGRKVVLGLLGLVAAIFGGSAAAVIAALQRFASLLPGG